METIINPSPVKTRRKFDATLKLKAVRDWLGSGKSAAVVAKELGLAENRLYAWRKLLPPAESEAKAALGTKRPAAADLEAELDAARREIRHLKEHRDILKKVRHPLRTASERFQRAHAMRNNLPIAMLCELFQVSPISFYDWDRRRSKPRPRAVEDLALAKWITTLHAESRQTYGSPRIVGKLRAQGSSHGRNRLARLMKSCGTYGRA